MGNKSNHNKPFKKRKWKEQQKHCEMVKKRRLAEKVAGASFSNVDAENGNSISQICQIDQIHPEEVPSTSTNSTDTDANPSDLILLQNVEFDEAFEGLVEDLKNSDSSSGSKQLDRNIDERSECTALNQSLNTNWILESFESALSTTTGNRNINGSDDIEALAFETDDQILQVEPEQSPSKSIFVGRRIIGVSSFFERLRIIADHGSLNCGLQSIELVSEKLHGLKSKFKFVCKMCRKTFIIDTDAEEQEQYPEINSCAVAATISIGCGHSQLQQFTAALNLPIMSVKMYQKIHDALSTEWLSLAQETMNNAAEKERNIAIAKGSVSESGIPIIDVIGDGCYAKRTYKKNYSSLSGAGALIGRETGEILYLGIRNKYCYTCDRAEKRNENAKEHTCFRNYSGPSTGMESEIILDGFKKSIETHNLIYGRLISDGDASTYSKIKNARPYKNENVNVEKIECRNHLLRNFVNKLTALKTDTKLNVKDRKLLTKTKILTMRGVITSAIKKNKNPESSDVQILYEDINLAHLHAFGDHSRCKQYFCDKVGKQEDTPNSFYQCPLWLRISIYVQHIAGHANSLIHDVDSNIVERYHSVVAKYVGGKRVNFSLKQSYGTRCHAAAVSFNTSKPISTLYKKMVLKSPRGKIKMLEERKTKNKILCKKYLRKKRRIHFTKKDANYGENCIQEDMSPDILDLSKKNFLRTLQKTDEQRTMIERDTVMQRNSSTWIQLHHSILTASHFARVIKRRADTPSAPIVKQILYQNPLDHVSSINHGIVNEKTALAQLALQENIQIQPCGLFIDRELPYLGATPDGLCGPDTIVEVKCPITAARLGLEEALSKKKVNFWKKDKNDWTVNKSHSWYYQVQGQLHITGFKKCIFAVWSNENVPLKVETIEKDDSFWDTKMREKLINFYNDCLLPEIVDGRHSRNMAIREPPYIAELIKNKKK